MILIIFYTREGWDPCGSLHCIRGFAQESKQRRYREELVTLHLRNWILALSNDEKECQKAQPETIGFSVLILVLAYFSFIIEKQNASFYCFILR